MPEVRCYAAGDAPAIVAIIRGLPDYFTGDVPGKAARDAAGHEAGVMATPPPSTSRPSGRPGDEADDRPGSLAEPVAHPVRDGLGSRGRGMWGGVAQESISLPAIPAIPVSAGALIFDSAGRLLILRPTYKSGWTIPGGVMEADGESPWQACQREVREETGLEVSHGRLAAMDFRPAKPGRLPGIRYLFDCGQVSDEELASVKLQPEEISDSRLVSLPEAFDLLRGPISRRVQSATGGHSYLEDGLPL